jgi:single-strand DNA-binding protein
MASFNQVTLVGNLTRDVEVRYIPSGAAVADVSLAVNEAWTNKDGSKGESVAFVECTLWGRTAEIAGEYLSKGSPVLFAGKLVQDNWDDKETGQKRSKLKVKVETLQLLGSKPGGQDAPAARQEAPQAQQRQQTAPAKQQSFYDAPAASGDDVPF